MVINKRAQFFLLAAVIISAVIISFGATVNKAVASNEPRNFYDLSHDVKKETNAVLDYEVYSGFTNNDNLTQFVNSLKKYIKTTVPKANIVFIYGNNDNMTIENYGNTSIYINNKIVKGPLSSAKSKICIGTNCKNMMEDTQDFNKNAGVLNLKESELKSKKNISMKIGQHNFVFPISNQRRVIFIMQKDVGNDNFITIG